jgi:hypothetical protein
MGLIYWAEERRKLKEMWRKDFLTPGWRNDPTLIARVVERLMEDLHEGSAKRHKVPKRSNYDDTDRH